MAKARGSWNWIGSSSYDQPPAGFSQTLPTCSGVASPVSVAFHKPLSPEARHGFTICTWFKPQAFRSLTTPQPENAWKMLVISARLVGAIPRRQAMEDERSRKHIRPRAPKWDLLAVHDHWPGSSQKMERDCHSDTICAAEQIYSCLHASTQSAAQRTCLRKQSLRLSVRNRIPSSLIEP